MFVILLGMITTIAHFHLVFFLLDTDFIYQSLVSKYRVYPLCIRLFGGPYYIGSSLGTWTSTSSNHSLLILREPLSQEHRMPFSECHWMKVKVTQSCPALCDPMDYTVHGILQARILEWVAFLFSRRSSQPRDWTQVSHITGGFFTSWATREAPKYWSA